MTAVWRYKYGKETIFPNLQTYLTEVTRYLIQMYKADCTRVITHPVTVHCLKKCGGTLIATLRQTVKQGFERIFDDPEQEVGILLFVQIEL